MTLQTNKPSSQQLHTTHSLQRKKNVALRVLPPSAVLNRHYHDSGVFCAFSGMMPARIRFFRYSVVSFRLSLLLNLWSTLLRRCVKNRQRFWARLLLLHFIRILSFEIGCIFLWWLKFTEFCHLDPKIESKLNVRASTEKINHTSGFILLSIQIVVSLFVIKIVSAFSIFNNFKVDWLIFLTGFIS